MFHLSNVGEVWRARLNSSSVEIVGKIIGNPAQTTANVPQSQGQSQQNPACSARKGRKDSFEKGILVAAAPVQRKGDY